MSLSDSIGISAAGMDAQSQRLRVVAENLANQDTTGGTPGADAYRRKTITFQEVMGQDDDVAKVSVRSIGHDSTPFQLRYDPSHPAADKDGYVKLPNVNEMVETMDMREAERSYSANLNTMAVARSMMTRTIDVLK
ncbi:flagellar basal body rod protein FlgC [Ameyamaea chiangmaiensis NBRC 103196]|uniref:Flagellar basal-body rod protein FlgC n=1 Tax=Ameyamaea chiangmaiensis TaxID=442969 RepID=A0A850PF92_9PROT|nr:flagellar basal body rod protein FlgC [Ameyamaea chiangmaiensis]MBS4075665.1 flagellar basal body rod protein FlgC [Ameyamaea chiangmaiensis]NVN40916.1 flagellar basal body rod protein FlgC [Ameyamaea chiangmaiensis]GBQ70599.1 flagellar basal body rod protein FlgC [Ameyamaea chiangmaiensis NBRC 103196]